MLKNPELKFIKFEYNAACAERMTEMFGDNFLGTSCDRHPNAIAVAHFYDNGFKRVAIVGQYVIAMIDKIEIVSEAEFKSKYCEEDPVPEQAALAVHAFECFTRPKRLNAIQLLAPYEAVFNFVCKHSLTPNQIGVTLSLPDWSMTLGQKGEKSILEIRHCDSFLVFDGTHFSVVDVSEFDRRYKRAI